jgi:hypothetical protein
MRSRKVGSAQWMSSKTTTSGLRRASSSRTALMPQNNSSFPYRSWERPMPDSMRLVASASCSPKQDFSLMRASSSLSSGTIPAACRNTSASGKNVMPSP